jgi:hypothetical protein
MRALFTIMLPRLCATISIRRFAFNAVELSVEDDGCGFAPDPDGAAREGRFGILGMRERTQQMGGGLVIESGKNQGTRIAGSEFPSARVLVLTTYSGRRHPSRRGGGHRPAPRPRPTRLSPAAQARATAASASPAARTAASMSASVCAVETKAVSNCAGGR